jgi:hypothetical protein
MKVWGADKVKHALRETREGIVDIAGAVAPYVKSPALLLDKMKVWKQQRQDMALALRLNRQLRRQFITAFNKSAAKKMSVEVNEGMKRYAFRNTVVSALLRPYEIFAAQNAPVKIGAAMVFFRAARMALYPVMGAWSVAVPLAAFIGARMAGVYKHAENKRQEADFAEAGFVVPCDFGASEGRAQVLGRDVQDGQAFGFPVMHRDRPEWVVSSYHAAGRTLTTPATMHAAAFEALRTGRYLPDVAAAFPGQAAAQNCAFALSVLMPALPVDGIIAAVSPMTKEIVAVPAPAVKKEGLSAAFHRAAKPFRDVSVAEAALSVLEPFCLQGKDTAASLAALSGRVTLDDIRSLVHLQSVGIVMGAVEAAEALRMARDPRFDGLSFRQIAEVALLPRDQSAAFDDLWKDRECRAHFDYGQLRDIVEHAQGWGGTALGLARHGYARTLSGEQLIELAQPENEHWARVYHDLRSARPDVEVSHETFKASVQAQGYQAVLRPQGG